MPKTIPVQLLSALEAGVATVSYLIKIGPLNDGMDSSGGPT